MEVNLQVKLVPCSIPSLLLQTRRPNLVEAAVYASSNWSDSVELSSVAHLASVVSPVQLHSSDRLVQLDLGDFLDSAPNCSQIDASVLRGAISAGIFIGRATIDLDTSVRTAIMAGGEITFSALLLPPLVPTAVKFVSLRAEDSGNIVVSVIDALVSTFTTALASGIWLLVSSPLSSTTKNSLASSLLLMNFSHSVASAKKEFAVHADIVVNTPPFVAINLVSIVVYPGVAKLLKLTGLNYTDINEVSFIPDREGQLLACSITTLPLSGSLYQVSLCLLVVLFCALSLTFELFFYSSRYRPSRCGYKQTRLLLMLMHLE